MGGGSKKEKRLNALCIRLLNTVAEVYTPCSNPHYLHFT
uniref:Uncharacterized protein n=1 Tax=Anguilla anguilla TaxID=7936 RepID=A0A0E9PLT5_ANGAN